MMRTPLPLRDVGADMRTDSSERIRLTRRAVKAWDWTQRCPSKQPDTGIQCGLPSNHSGHRHHVLIPSEAPWFPRSEDRETT